MAKNKYIRPILMDITPVEDPTIEFGGSQGTSGEDSMFTWDSAIDPDDIDMFWLSYDETDLVGIDVNGDLYISATEFYDWLDSIGGW